MSISINNSFQKEPIFSITFECDAIFKKENIEKIQKVVFYALALLPAALAISANPAAIFLGSSFLVNTLVIGSLALAALGIYEITNNIFMDLYKNPAYLNTCKENTTTELKL